MRCGGPERRVGCICDASWQAARGSNLCRVRRPSGNAVAEYSSLSNCREGKLGSATSPGIRPNNELPRFMLVGQVLMKPRKGNRVNRQRNLRVAVVVALVQLAAGCGVLQKADGIEDADAVPIVAWNFPTGAVQLRGAKSARELRVIREVADQIDNECARSVRIASFEPGDITEIVESPPESRAVFGSIALSPVPPTDYADVGVVLLLSGFDDVTDVVADGTLVGWTLTDGLLAVWVESSRQIEVITQAERVTFPVERHVPCAA